MDKRLRNNLPKLVAGLILLLVTGGLVMMIKSFISNAETPKKRQVQQISLIKPPPPRPEEKPPEPEKLPEPEIPQMQMAEPVPDQPADPSNEPPPGEQLGVDAEGGAGGDGFGLLGKKGGRDITTIGGGAGGSRARWYAGLLADRIENSVNRDPDLVKQLRGRRPVVKVWVDTSGRVERVECETDVPDAVRGQIKDRLLSLTLSERPDGVSQPIWYRLKARAG